MNALKRCLAATALVALASCTQKAAAPAPAPTATLGDAWGTQLEQLPDWTGIWFVTEGLMFPGRKNIIAVADPAKGQGGFGYGDMPGTHWTGAPYNAEYQKVYDERVRLAREEFKVFDYMGSCVVPHGMPRIIGGGPGPTEFIVTPEQTTIIWDYMNEQRRIYTDGRPHPKEGQYPHTMMGHSIGHWEGQTLVVDTRFMLEGIYDRSGAPYSDQVHLMERIRLIDPNTIEFQMTLEDPVTFTKPWEVTRVYRRVGQPGGERPMMEPEGAYCESHRNPISAEGQTAILPGEQPK